MVLDLFSDGYNVDIKYGGGIFAIEALTRKVAIEVTFVKFSQHLENFWGVSGMEIGMLS